MFLETMKLPTQTRAKPTNQSSHNSCHTNFNFDPSITHPAHLPLANLDAVGPLLQGTLDGLDKHGDGRQSGLLQPVELVKAAPRPAARQAGEDEAHRLGVHILQTIHGIMMYSRGITMHSAKMWVYIFLLVKKLTLR